MFPQPPAPSRNLSEEAIAVAHSVMNGTSRTPPLVDTAVKVLQDIDEDDLSPRSVARGRELNENVRPTPDERSGSVVWVGRKN